MVGIEADRFEPQLRLGLQTLVKDGIGARLDGPARVFKKFQFDDVARILEVDEDADPFAFELAEDSFEQPHQVEFRFFHLITPFGLATTFVVRRIPAILP